VASHEGSTGIPVSTAGSAGVSVLVVSTVVASDELSPVTDLQGHRSTLDACPRI